MVTFIFASLLGREKVLMYNDLIEHSFSLTGMRRHTVLNKRGWRKKVPYPFTVDIGGGAYPYKVIITM